MNATEANIFNNLDRTMEVVKRFITIDNYRIETIERELGGLSVFHIKYILCYLCNAYKNNNEHIITQKIMDSVLSSLDIDKQVIKNYIEKAGYPDYLNDSLVLVPMRVLAINLNLGTKTEPGENMVLIKEDINISPQEVIYCTNNRILSFQLYKKFILDPESLARLNVLEDNLNNTVILDLMKRLNENPEGDYPLINSNRVLTFKKNEKRYEQYEKGLIELLEKHINLSKLNNGLENFKILYRSLNSVISDLCKDRLNSVILNNNLILDKEYIVEDKVSLNINIEMFINKVILRSSIGLNNTNEAIFNMGMKRVDKKHGGLLKSKLKELKTSNQVIDKKYIERTIIQIGEFFIYPESFKELSEIGCDIFLNNKALKDDYIYASNDICDYEGTYDLDKPYSFKLTFPRRFEGLVCEIIELLTYSDENYKKEIMSNLIEKQQMKEDLIADNVKANKKNRFNKF